MSQVKNQMQQDQDDAQDSIRVTESEKILSS